MSKYRNLILQSAKDLLSYKSFDQITIKDICQRAGVANSTFFYHFKNKEALISCLHDNNVQQQACDLRQIISSPDLLEQTIIACSMCAINAQRSGPLLTAQYYKQRVEAKEPGNDFRRYTTEELDTACMFVARAQQAGIIKNNQPADQLAYAAIRMAHGVIIEWCASKTSFDLLQRCRELLLVIFNA